MLDEGYERSSLTEVEAVLDSLSPATSEQVYSQTLGMSPRAVAAVAASRADAGGGGGGGGALSSAEITLTNAQIKALPTTAVELVSAAGAGTVLVPVLAFMSFTWAANYTNISANCDIAIDYDPDASGSPALMALKHQLGGPGDLLAAGMSTLCIVPPHVGSDGTTLSAYSLLRGDAENLAVKIKASNGGFGDFTGGDAGNSLKITVFYFVADIS